MTSNQRARIIPTGMTPLQHIVETGARLRLSFQNGTHGDSVVIVPLIWEAANQYVTSRQSFGQNFQVNQHFSTSLAHYKYSK